MVNFKSISLVFIGIIKIISTQTPSCMKYECDNTLLSKKCMRPANTTNTDLKTCTGRNYCNFDPTLRDGNCQAINYLSKQFIGGPCNTKDDCLNASDCTDNKCTSTSTDCTKDTDCSIGQFCGLKNANKVCSSQMNVGESCTRNEECVNTAGCQSSSNKCVQYFSLEDGADAKNSERSLCKSGFVLNDKCSSASLVTKGVCTSECSYQFNGTVTNSTDLCVCGKNFNGDRYCTFGANSTEHVNSMNMIMEFFNNTHPCHTTERFVPCVSQGFDRNSTTHFAFEYQKILKNYHNGLVVNSVEFSGQTTDSCVLPVLGHFDQNLIKPVSTNQCPKYECKNNQKTCTKSMNPNNFDSSNITITLSNICNKTQSCELPNIADIQDRQSVEGSCLNNDNELNRFPGEQCLVNSDCKNNNCTDSKVCQFVALGETCSNEEPIDFTKQCGVGAYCNSENKCAEQIKRDQNCTQTFHCQNNLVCFNKTCSMEYGSVKDGEQINTTLLSEDFGTQLGYLCQTGFFDDNQKKCFSYTYANQTSMVADADGFVKCNINGGNECVYETSTNGTFKRNCDCGFNAEGYGYCPVDRNGKKNLILIIYFSQNFKFVR